jgi:hypothetical protein
MQVVCSDADAIFDVPDTTEDDYDETWMAYELFQSTVGN